MSEKPPTGSRRRFLWTAWTALLGVAAAEAAWIVARILRPRGAKGTEDAAGVMIAGPVDRFGPGSVTAFPEGGFYLVRLDDGGFLALSRVCTHLGCSVPWVDAERRARGGSSLGQDRLDPAPHAEEGVP